MTMALAVAMVACQAAAGKPGEPGEAGQPGAPGEPGGVPPSLDDAIGDQKLAASGAMASVDIDLDEHFYDPDGVEGETLTYVASSSAPEKVTATVTGSTLTLTAVAVGPAKITVRATDVDGLSSGSARFDVTVAETAPPQNTAIPDQTLYQADSPKTIALADHFMHTSTITYDVDDSPEGFVAATIADGVLTLTPRVVGQTIVTVTATADNRNTMDDFIVTVKAGSRPTPLPTPSDPPQRVGTITAREVEVGASLAPIDVSAYFSPTGLTYRAASSDQTKATATIPTGSNSLTIAGVAIGSASVTVTATDSDGRTETQTISVTVTAASAPYKPSTVTIAGKGKTRDVSIAEGQTLQSLNQAVVTATRKSGSTTVWTLKGEMKGKSEVRIWNADQTLDKTISVTVANTPPMERDDAPNVVIGVSTGAAPLTHVYVDKDGEVTDAADTVVADPTANDGKRLYHKARFAFSDYFKDADSLGLGDIDKDGYKADSNEPYIKVVKTLSDGVVIDVMKDVGASFPLVVYVEDKAGAMSEKVTLSVQSPTPIADRYEVSQDDRDGDFGSATVFARQGIDHTLTFEDFGSAPDGFHFVSVFESDQLRGNTVVGTTPTTFPELPDGGLPSATAEDESSNPAYYKVTTSGPLADVDLVVDPTALTPAGTAQVPTLMFKVTGSGSATVTITYHRLVGKDVDDPANQIDQDERAWISDTETLSLTISSS